MHGDRFWQDPIVFALAPGSKYILHFVVLLGIVINFVSNIMNFLVGPLCEVVADVKALHFLESLSPVKSKEHLLQESLVAGN
jgi:hypothetical protein